MEALVYQVLLQLHVFMCMAHCTENVRNDAVAKQNSAPEDIVVRIAHLKKYSMTRDHNLNVHGVCPAIQAESKPTQTRLQPLGRKIEIRELIANSIVHCIPVFLTMNRLHKIEPALARLHSHVCVPTCWMRLRRINHAQIGVLFALNDVLMR